ncbi:MAG TPA: metallopeptidase family protein [Candidatus Eisenbacteria bacterium]|nr:metallopeptidase family protein [Candidatus Eisenbacteria bacterium]
MYDALSEAEWDQVDQVWDLLEGSEVDRARTETNDLLGRRPRHPDLLVLDAAVAIEEGDPDRALDALRGAERSADPALFFHLRALARFHRVDLEAARADADKALAVRPQLAEAHALLSRIHELLGDQDSSARHAEAANDIDPETFPPPLEVSDEAFDQLVEKSLAELPEVVRDHLQQIPVMVEPLPSRHLLIAEKPPLAPDLLGLFVGRHLLEQSHADLPAAPGAIYLFRRNLLRACRDQDELSREIRITVQHEVGHYLGLDEDDLERWGLA